MPCFTFLRDRYTRPDLGEAAVAGVGAVSLPSRRVAAPLRRATPRRGRAVRSEVKVLSYPVRELLTINYCVFILFSSAGLAGPTVPSRH